jgi:plasmid replication initiation protein
MIENSYDTIQIPGQMSIQEFLDEDLPESLFAVSKIFAQARKEMNTAELKAFTFALTHIKFKDPNASNKIRLDKKTLANIVGIDSNCTDLSQHLKRSLKDLPKHSHFIIENESADENDENAFEMESGITITSLRFYRNYVVMTFNPDYMPLFAGLDKDYITMWSGDIFRMQSERSITFYEQLRLYSDTSQLMCKHGFGVKAIKDLFDIPKDGKGSYMRPDGHFNRPAFEKKVLDPLVEDLSKCKMIQLVANEDGSF